MEGCRDEGGKDVCPARSGGPQIRITGGGRGDAAAARAHRPAPAFTPAGFCPQPRGQRARAQRAGELHRQVKGFITAWLIWGETEAAPPPGTSGEKKGGFSAREQKALRELPFATLFEAKAARAAASGVTGNGSGEPEPASRGQAELRGVGDEGRLQPVPPELGRPPGSLGAALGGGR